MREMDSDAPVTALRSSEGNIIQAINRDTVHRICSGQVVLSLAIAVKELVENAIDAGATIINIHLQEYGSELIEVSDNGSGVLKENFQALTLKHFTSKIQQFDDLSTLSTLGFRGEALSSLCALSDLSIVTKHIEAEHATKLVYDRNGKIVSETLGAREPGTTITLGNLFSTLPVRRKEFVKNLKREFNKMCQLLYAYCLVSKGIKFSCTNTTSKGSKNTLVATGGLSTVKDNITNVFGAKQLASLIEVEVARPEEPIIGEYRLKLADGEPLPVTFDFYVSSVVHGSGRSTTDRQFLYINSRPCEPTKVTKLVNEVYRQYNNHQYPFIYLNILTKSCLVDVNVTPDKRQVFLEKENVLLATLKQSLLEAFKNFPSSFKMQNLELTQASITVFGEVRKPQSLKRSHTDSGVAKGSILDKFKKRSKTEELRRANSSEMLESFVQLATKVVRKEAKRNNENHVQKIFEKLKNEDEGKVAEKVENKGQEGEEWKNRDHVNVVEEGPEKRGDEYEIEEVKIVCKTDRPVKTVVTERIEEKIENLNESVKKEDGGSAECKKPKMEESIPSTSTSTKRLQETIMEEDLEISLDNSIQDRSNRKSITLNITLDDIKAALTKKQTTEENRDVIVRFRSKINPASNKSAEEELQKQISKEDFAKMTIIGQFNLGFIITKLQNDLFIIDQHATDEKYNFEQLQANTVMENQVLVNPKPLQLTAASESLLIQNEDIFRKNGFTFKIDESAPCTKKVQLASVPLSKNVVFGKDDIDEMLFMLQDSNHTMCRPSRLRAMFASRACRKSVMIGQHLSKKDMTSLVQHMGEIEQPWNCPHGRPTMRHLINLDLIDQREN